MGSYAGIPSTGISTTGFGSVLLIGNRIGGGSNERMTGTSTLGVSILFVFILGTSGIGIFSTSSPRSSYGNTNFWWLWFIGKSSL